MEMLDRLSTHVEGNLRGGKSALGLPERAMVVLLFFLPFDQMASLIQVGGPGVVSLFKGLFLLTLILWGSRCLLTKDPSLFGAPFKSPIHIAGILFVLISVLCLMNSRALSTGAVTVMRRVGFLLFFFLIVELVRTDRMMRLCVGALLLSSLFSSSSGIYELITGKPILVVSKFQFEERTELLKTERHSARIQGFAGDPDLHDHMFLIFSGLALAAFYGAESWAPRIALSILFLLYTVNIGAAGSRGGWISFVICLVSFVLLSDLRRKWLLMGAMVALFAVLLLALGKFTNTAIFERLTGEAGGGSITLRWAQNLVSLEMVRKHPILGIGTGSSEGVYHRYLKVAPGLPKLPMPGNINGYLHLWAENGTLGLMAFLAIIALLLNRLLTALLSTGDRYGKPLLMGITASFLANLFSLLVFPVIDSEQNWLVIGLGAAAVALYGKPR